MSRRSSSRTTSSHGDSLAWFQEINDLDGPPSLDWLLTGVRAEVETVWDTPIEFTTLSLPNSPVRLSVATS